MIVILNVQFQFQNRKYSRLKWFKCGKKGYGLKALERVAKGHFIIEYVGEVIGQYYSSFLLSLYRCNTFTYYFILM